MRIGLLALTATLALLGITACSDDSPTSLPSADASPSSIGEDTPDGAVTTAAVGGEEEEEGDDIDLGLPFGTAFVLLDGQVLTFDVVCSVNPLVNSAGPEKTSGNALIGWYLEQTGDGYQLVAGDAGTGESWTFADLTVADSAQGYEINATSTSSLTGASAPFQASVVCS